MIFKTAEQIEPQGPWANGTSDHLGAAARRALDTHLADLYEPVTREWLGKHLPASGISRGLHLASGSGENTFLLAALLGEQATLLGLDADPVLVEYARQAKAVKGWDRIRFSQMDFSSGAAGPAYDLIYTRIWNSAQVELDGLLQTIRRRLKPGGWLLAEMMRLSDFKSYPYNHAFARSMELIGHLENDQPQAEPLSELLRGLGFATTEIDYSHPAFILPDHRRIVSLALEGCRGEILRQGRASGAELNALLLELKAYEKQNDTLISRPGILQIRAGLPPLDR